MYGNEETCLGLVSNTNFERNLKSLKGAYEQYVLNMGELDERILLDYRKLNNPCMYLHFNPKIHEFICLLIVVISDETSAMKMEQHQVKIIVKKLNHIFLLYLLY